MNSAEFNMVLWLAFGGLALAGKVAYETVVTRAEKRRAATQGPAGATQETSSPLAHHSP